MKIYSIFAKAPGLQPHHQMQLYINIRILVGGEVGVKLQFKSNNSEAYIKLFTMPELDSIKKIPVQPSVQMKYVMSSCNNCPKNLLYLLGVYNNIINIQLHRRKSFIFLKAEKTVRIQITSIPLT